jgi:ankyrin repeat protein
MPLYTAASMGHLDAACCLVSELGADVNQERRVGDRCTPLITAIKEGHIDMMLCLVNDLGADVNKGDRHGSPPLHYAIFQGAPKLATLLVNKLGADVNQGDNVGYVPLHLAVEDLDLDMMRFLVVELGANVNKTMKDGAQPLFLAIAEGYLDGVRCCVRELGAEIDYTGGNGDTPLIVAARWKRGEIAKWLVKAGADPQARHPVQGTAADAVGAFPAQTAYLEAKAHCAQPGCTGAGTKKCQGCMQGRYCGRSCHLAHWPAHKDECRAIGAAMEAENDFLCPWGV